MKTRNNCKGFTFLELLVVFSLISIIVLMFLPSIHRMREKGRQATCIGNQRQLAVAAILYANECGSNLPISIAALNNGNYLPDAGNTPAESILGNTAYAEMGMSVYYQNNTKILQCPESTGDVSYGLNVLVAGLRLDLIKNAAALVMISDSNFGAISSFIGDDNSKYVEAISFRHGPVWDESYAVAIAAFIDGHVEVFKESDWTIIDPWSTPTTDTSTPPDNESTTPPGDTTTPPADNESVTPPDDGTGNNGLGNGGEESQGENTAPGEDPSNPGNGHDGYHLYKEKKGNNGLGNGGEESQGEDTPKGEDPSNPAHGGGN